MMHSRLLIHILSLVFSLHNFSAAIPVFWDTRSAAINATCYYLPHDADWPDHAKWDMLNEQVGGRLIRGTPLAQTCYDTSFNSTQCATIQEDWTLVTPYLSDPVNTMSPYWQNNSCSPFAPYTHANHSGFCTLGNQAQYAIGVSDANNVIAGLKFGHDKNIRLTIKNTGHDYLGRSTGDGSLALWTHNLKNITFIDNYTCATYTGPAVRFGAGVGSLELTQVANKKGLVVVGASCPTVGLAGGWSQGGGHGPLTAAYGLGADNVLEYEVVTATGQHLAATPFNSHADLYWALSGGGSGNYAVVLSTTMKAYPDMPVAGAAFSFANSDPHIFWLAVTKWIQRLLVLDYMPGLKTIASIAEGGFAMNFATWPGATASQLAMALDPFWADLKALRITLVTNTTTSFPTYLQHFDHYTTGVYTVNETVVSRLIPRDFVQDKSKLESLVVLMRNMTSNGGIFNLIAQNVSHSHAAGATAVLPAWRTSLFHMSFGLSLDQDASWVELSNKHNIAADWQNQYRDLTPGSGSYINEATFSDPTWKDDYFGTNYDRLLRIKHKYDPGALLWERVAVGSDQSRVPAADGRLCRIR